MHKLQESVRAALAVLAPSSSSTPNTSEKREAAHSLGVCAIEPSGRRTILQMPDAVSIIGSQLTSADAGVQRYSALGT